MLLPVNILAVKQTLDQIGQTPQFAQIEMIMADDPEHFGQLRCRNRETNQTAVFCVRDVQTGEHFRQLMDNIVRECGKRKPVRKASFRFVH